MKHLALLLSIFVVTMVIAFWLNKSQPTPALAQHTATSSSPKQLPIVGVDELMKNVDQYKTQLSVEGVVSKVAADKQMVSLIDTEEVAHCGVTTCAKLVLPVQWLGKMPSIKETIRATGEVKLINGKLIFVAQKVEKLETSVENK